MKKIAFLFLIFLITICGFCQESSPRGQRIVDNNITFPNGYPIEFLSKLGFNFKTSQDTLPFFTYDGCSTGYTNHGEGTFNVNPVDGTKGFWIGEQRLYDLLKRDPSPGPCPCQEKKYAFFLIPVNYSSSGEFTDFELKASTNNFSHLNYNKCVQFYSQSEIANIGSSNSIDRMWLFTCTNYCPTNNGFHGDARSYYYIRNTGNNPQTSWTNHLTTVAVLVEPNCLKRNPETSDESSKWLNESNQELIWTYHRYESLNGSANHEIEDGNKHLWRVITPIRWFSKMPEWARIQIEAFND